MKTIAVLAALRAWIEFTYVAWVILAAFGIWVFQGQAIVDLIYVKIVASTLPLAAVITAVPMWFGRNP